MAVPPSPTLAQQSSWMPAALPECKIERLNELSRMKTLGIRDIGKMSWDALQGISHDTLTGLPLNRLFEARIDHLLSHTDNAFAVVIVNCQKFRLINELYGRETANDVLRMLAHRLKKLDQPSVFVARLRDDRFGFIVNKAHRHLADDFIEHLTDVLRKPMRFRGQRYQLGYAVGLHWRQQGEHTSAHNLILDAETTLRHASARRDQDVVAIFEHPLLAQSNEDALIEMLGEQLREGTLPVKVYPVINIRTGMKYSYQAVPTLLDNGEEIPLHSIFRLAERSGLMLALTEYTIEMAIARFKEVYADLAMYLSVKVSRLDTQNCRLMDNTYHKLEQAGLPVHKFKFELHEEVVNDDWQSVINEVFELANSECSKQFKRLQGKRETNDRAGLHVTKVMWVHSHLLRKAENDAQHLQMLRSVIDLARSQGVDVMVEGLETEQDTKLALELGVLFGHGISFGQPASLLMTN